jgi:O-methyltransferase
MHNRIVKTALDWLWLGASASEFEHIYSKYSSYTMLARSSYVKNLSLAYQHRHVEGCVVECGVWRGGMIAGMADVLGPTRDYVLCDSFKGLPAAKSIDGSAALAWQADKTGPNYHDNCAATRADAEEVMRMSKASPTRVHFVQGWFDRTLPDFKAPGPIALLRLDGDWYESTMSCLQHLYKQMARDGLVIIDDYYTWDGCARAVHDYLSREQLSLRIRQWENHVCYLVAN